MNRPGAAGVPTTTREASAVACSWMTMASAPSGTAAPVKMRTASPAPILPPNAAPAAAAPITRKVAGGDATSAARTA